MTGQAKAGAWACAAGGLAALAVVFEDRPGPGVRVEGTEIVVLAAALAVLAGGTLLLARGRSSGRWRPPLAAFGALLFALALTAEQFGASGGAGFGTRQALLALVGLALAAVAVVERPRIALARARSLPLALVVVLAAGVLVRCWFMYAYRPGFFGFTDSLGYFVYANSEIFGTPYRPAGESIFVYLLRSVSAELAFAVLAHHLLGIATGVLLYLSCRRGGAGPWLSAVPAAVVLLAGSQLFLEHSTMSEPTFTVLLAGAVLALVRAREGGSSWWFALAGVLLGAATLVRVVGLGVVVVLAVWLLLDGGGRVAARLRRSAALAAPVVALIAVYLVAHHGVTGHWGLTRTQGSTLYARAATFADCSEFSPPQGTEVLCERLDPDKRPPAVDYQFAPTSPAIKAFGFPPAPMQATGPDDFRWEPEARLGRFGRAAMLGQPLAYAETIALALANFATPVPVGPPSVTDWDTKVLVANMRGPQEEGVERFFGAVGYTTRGFTRRTTGALDAYGRHVRVEGPLSTLFVVLAVAGLAFGRGPLRRAAIPFAVTAGALMVATAAALYYDARYATPVYGFLAAAAALGAGALAARLRPA